MQKSEEGGGAARRPGCMLLVEQAEGVGGTARRPECLLLVEQAEERGGAARRPGRLLNPGVRVSRQMALLKSQEGGPLLVGQADGGLEEDIVERRGGPGVTSDGTVEEHRGGPAAH